ncbi:MAG: IS701 family transposase [Acidobacteria bacterium]|nr:IS701 family transposase [Acidobacteriota bacterium]
MSTSGPRDRRLAAYLDTLATAVGHADRHAPFRNYCKGLLLPCERKSIEPMAALLQPDAVQRMRQSLHHFVSQAPWSDDAVLEQVRNQVLPHMQRNGPVVAWIVEDTAFPKQGRHSVGVARQFSSELDKKANCQLAVSLSLATWNASLPVAYRLFLPEQWTLHHPQDGPFQTKPEIALAQIRAARESGVPQGVVLAADDFGANAKFRAALTDLRLPYMVNVTATTGKVRQIAMKLPPESFRIVAWRQDTPYEFRSRFAAVRVSITPGSTEWLLIEWPDCESEPSRYWLSTMPAKTSLIALVKMAKHRWIVQRDFDELKRELGLGHFEGRNWRGFHHHATLCIAAFGFLLTERTRFSQPARAGSLGLHFPKPPARFHPRGAPES